MKIDMTLRRWCPQCQEVTASAICQDGHSPDEICRECGCWCKQCCDEED